MVSKVVNHGLIKFRYAKKVTIFFEKSPLATPSSMPILFSPDNLSITSYLFDPIIFSGIEGLL